MKTSTISKIIVIFAILYISAYANAATSLSEAFSQGTIKGELRAYSFGRDFENNTQDKGDVAVGTSLYFHTAKLYGMSAGLAYVTGNDLGSDNDKAVYGLLATDKNGNHDSFSRIQEAYLQADYFNTNIKLGTHEIDTPFAHIDPIRLQNRSFKGISVINKSIPNLTLDAHYITEYVDYSDSDYKNVAVIREVRNLDEDKGLIILGAKYNLPVESLKSDVQAWYYNLEDVFSQTYLKGSAEKQFGDYTLHATPSVLYQKPIGDELAGDVKTEQYGGNVGVKAYGAWLRAYYAKTGDNDLIANYGDEKAVIMQANNARRAEEKIYAVKLDYDFARLGVKGLSTYVFLGKFDTPDSGENASSDISETDLAIRYDFQGALEGLTARVRYAMVKVDDGEDYTDLRLYLSYKFGNAPKKPKI